MSVTTLKSKRLRATRGACQADGCTSLASERVGIRGRLPKYCDKHAPWDRRATRKHQHVLVEAEPIEYITITEWKARYGAPGGGGSVDESGRIVGFTQRYELLEPDYCEDAPEAA